LLVVIAVLPYLCFFKVASDLEYRHFVERDQLRLAAELDRWELVEYHSNTTQAITVGVNPAVTLAAGTYMAEIMLIAADGSKSLIIPVTMTINPNTAAYFDNVAGAVDSGTAPSSLSVSIVSANLPGKGLTAGNFNGTVVLTSGSDRQTTPVSVVVGTSVLQPVAPLSFGKSFGGANPAAQALNLASTATNFAVFGQGASANGGSWLTISPPRSAAAASSLRFRSRCQLPQPPRWPQVLTSAKSFSRRRRGIKA
jgi:hypothetical protein